MRKPAANRISVLDTTLRDGAQGEGIAFSVSDKLQVVQALDALGIDFIEAGNPGSNPKDLEFFQKAARLPLQHAQLCAFGSTCRKDTAPADDASLRAILQAKTPVAVLFGKAWPLHVHEVLGISLEENLALIRESVAFLVAHGKTVFFDAEHFFDGFAQNTAYAKQVLQTALEAGANTLTLCDTNGGTMPLQVQQAVQTVAGWFPEAALSMHAHNDAGCAVANTFLAVQAGAVQVQGTLLGIGERCGNADLSTILPGLRLKYGCEIHADLFKLQQTARRVAEISNTKIDPQHPYIGASAFAHKGGMHIDGVLKIHESFEHVDPQQVGNRRRLLLSEVSGRSMVAKKLADIDPTLTKDSPVTAEILDTVKQMEHYGYHYEAADASFLLMVQQKLGIFTPHFEVVFYKTIGEFPEPQEGSPASAMIKVRVGDKEEIAAAVGNGPVNALDLALRKVLTVFYPQIGSMRLTDYKVRVLDQNRATAARVRVLIETTDEKHTWTTIGVSNDVVEASMLALLDAMEYKLAQKAD